MPDRGTACWECNGTEGNRAEGNWDLAILPEPQEWPPSLSWHMGQLGPFCLSWSYVISSQMRVPLQCSSQTSTGTLLPVHPAPQLRKRRGQDQPRAHPLSQNHGPEEEEGPRPAHQMQALSPEET